MIRLIYLLGAGLFMLGNLQLQAERGDWSPRAWLETIIGGLAWPTLLVDKVVWRGM